VLAKRINCRVRSIKGLGMDLVAKNLNIYGVMQELARHIR
jgi:hypothetical protein